MKVARRGTEKGVYHQIKVPLRITLLLYQKEGREVTPCSGLPKTERTNNPRHLPITPNPGFNTTNRRRLGIHQIRRTMGVQQHTNQGWRPMEGSVQNVLWHVPTRGNVFWNE